MIEHTNLMIVKTHTTLYALIALVFQFYLADTLDETFLLQFLIQISNKHPHVEFVFS